MLNINKIDTATLWKDRDIYEGKGDVYALACIDEELISRGETVKFPYNT